MTGGAGFIGSHLVERLLDEGFTVHVVDDLSTGSLDNLGRLVGHEALTVTVGSVATRLRVDERRAPEPSGFCRSDFEMERIGTNLETGIRRPADRSSQGR
mgnify:CR=1 FL=1